MPGTAQLIITALDPVLAGTVFDGPQGSGSAGGSSVIWCAASADFRQRHPSLTDAFDDLHPDGCTDLGIYVDGDGRLDRATLESMDIDDGLVGRPIEDALPVLAERLRDLLSGP
ncbi:hypothetical protein [Nocardioides sp. SR21]|uniref:hypothetical protein n=1 Tax=Nocardioides sp. SR21 TaxID=2919501 RepID=UPI001FAB3632|nr:hypothetical protein [Nocardioides sp. SR21]